MNFKLKLLSVIVLLTLFSNLTFGQAVDSAQQAAQVKANLDTSNTAAKNLIDQLLAENQVLKNQVATAQKTVDDTNAKLVVANSQMDQISKDLKIANDKADVLQKTQNDLKNQLNAMQTQLTGFKDWIQRVITDYLEPLGKLFTNSTTNLSKDIDTGKSLIK